MYKKFITFSNLVDSGVFGFNTDSFSLVSFLDLFSSPLSLGLFNFRFLFSVSSGIFKYCANFFDKSSARYSDTIP